MKRLLLVVFCLLLYALFHWMKKLVVVRASRVSEIQHVLPPKIAVDVYITNPGEPAGVAERP